MIQLTINNVQYDLWQSWNDIQLSHFVSYMKDIQPTEPELLNELITRQHQENKYFFEIATDVENAKILPFIVSKLAHFSNIPKEVLYETKLEHVFRLYLMLESGLSKFSYNEKFTNFKHENQVFYLPKKHMQDATVIEFIDAAQFQKQVEGLNAGQWECLPRVMCILCKKKKEKYIDHNRLWPARETMFGRVTMDKALQVIFFLIKLSAKLSIRSQTYSVPTVLARQLAVLKNMRNRTVGTA